MTEDDILSLRAQGYSWSAIARLAGETPSSGMLEADRREAGHVTVWELICMASIGAAALQAILAIAWCVAWLIGFPVV